MSPANQLAMQHYIVIADLCITVQYYGITMPKFELKSSSGIAASGRED